MYKAVIGNVEIELETSERIFSPSGADKGTLAMLETAVKALGEAGKKPEKILDLGCGAGIAGIFLANEFSGAEVLFSDIDEECVQLTQRNLERNGVPPDRAEVLRSDVFENIRDNDFDLILSNPPYHTDFSVAKAIIEGSFRHLKTGGRLFMVTKRLDWYKNKLIHIFGGVRITRTGDGYFVFEAEKRTERPANVKPVKKR